MKLRLLCLVIACVVLLPDASLIHAQQLQEASTACYVSAEGTDFRSAVSHLSSESKSSIHTILSAKTERTRGKLELPQNATLRTGIDMLCRRVAGLKVVKSRGGIVLIDSHELRSIDWVNSNAKHPWKFSGSFDKLVESTAAPTGWLYFPPSGDDDRHIDFQCRDVTLCQGLATAAEKAGLQLRLTIDPTPRNFSVIEFVSTQPPFQAIDRKTLMPIKGVVRWTFERTH